MLHEQFEHQNAANTRENERFQLNNVANAFEMAASSSKLLQIARKTNRTGNPPRKTKQNRKNIQNHSGPHDIQPGYQMRM